MTGGAAGAYPLARRPGRSRFSGVGANADTARRTNFGETTEGQTT
jgi:hypothetical protein